MLEAAVCCLEPSSSLPGGTTHMQVNNVELWNVSKKKASSEPGTTTASFVQNNWQFKAANDEKIHKITAQGGAHRIRGCSGYTWQTFHSSANSIL